MTPKKITAIVSAICLMTLSSCGAVNESDKIDTSSNKQSSKTDTHELSTGNSNLEELLDSNMDLLESASNIMEDIELKVDKEEITIGQDNTTVEFSISTRDNVDKINLIFCDTNEAVGTLVKDDADGIYKMYYELPTSISSDPDISEDKYFYFYATYEYEGITHMSNNVEIWVLEQFTDKELDDMETVDATIQELTNSQEFKDASFSERKEMALEILNDLAEQGLIKKLTIIATDDTISFEYSCGVYGGIQIKSYRDFDIPVN